MNNKKATKAGFIIPSVIGIFLFMIPIKFDGSWTIAVKILADAISGAIGGILPTLCCIVLTISAVMCVIALFKPKFITENKLLSDAFSCGPIWVVSRVLGCIFCWMTYLQVGQDKGTGIAAAITGADQGGLALDLIVGLVIIFLIASYLLPLLLDFGLLEYVGAMLTKFMRPIFKVPGRAAVDCITSWIGDGTLGVMLTCNQYEGGYYSTREASIISTCFSAVSITFSLVVLAEVGLTQYFGVYYLLICFVGIVCAIICPRIWPLAKKPDTYLVEGRAMPDELPDGYTSSHQYGLDLALKRVSEHKGIGEFFANGTKNCLNMWFGVLPTVMCIGTVALLLANYTPLFDWLGMPFRPLLSVLGVPDVEAAASTMVVGFTDMFTPAIIISGAQAQPMTCFIVAVISITQVLFLDEVGGLILSSKLPINLLELFVIFLEITIISLLIVCPIAHLIF
jgi:nucleoside recognition membrane protein YjiH